MDLHSEKERRPAGAKHAEQEIAALDARSTNCSGRTAASCWLYRLLVPFVCLLTMIAVTSKAALAPGGGPGAPAVRGLAFLSDGRNLVVAGGRTVSLWSVPEARRLRRLTENSAEVRSLATCDNGALIVCGGGKAGQFGAVRVWEGPACRERPPLTSRTDLVTEIALSPDGRWLAAANRDGSVRVHSLEFGTLRTTIAHRGNGTVTALAFGPDGRSVISGSADHAIRVWDAATGALLRTMKGHTGALRALYVPPRQITLISAGDRTVRFWDDPSGRPLRVVRDGNAEIVALAGLPDGGVAAASRDGQVRLIEIKTGNILRRLRTGAARLTALAVHPNGETLAVGSDTGAVLLYDRRSGQRTTSLPAATAP
jgi:WD40 repeat protein